MKATSQTSSARSKSNKFSPASLPRGLYRRGPYYSPEVFLTPSPPDTHALPAVPNPTLLGRQHNLH